MNPILLEAVQNAECWRERFTRREYAEAFKAYTQTFGPAYAQAVREAGEDGLAALADAILDALEAGWACHRFWNRAMVRTNEKLMMVQYLSPMLLSLETPGCRRLAECLRDGWGARWPREAYRIASFKRINGGFRNVILGIELPDKRRAEEEEEE